MSTRADRERSTKQNERHQAILAEMLNVDANKYCADCRSKGPRWASWNLGVFVCIRCAGIHRNLGVHISKMKSVNLDTWTPDQIECVRSKGNGIVNAMYEYSLPDNFRRPSDDSAVEAFIRSKYERKQYYKKQDQPAAAAAATRTSSGPKADKPKKESKKKSESRTPKTTSTTVAAVPRPSAPGTPRATAKSTPATPDLLGADFNAAPPRPASANDAMGAFMGSSSTPANPDLFGTTAPAQPAQPAQPDLFANAPANAFAQQPQVPQKEGKESILSLYGQGQPQMAGMGAGVPNGMSAGQMAYQQQVYMQQQMQQQMMMQQQMAMQQQQLAMQQQAMQVNQVQSQMARLRMSGPATNGAAAANGWPAGGQMQQQPQQPQQPGQTMNTMLWN